MSLPLSKNVGGLSFSAKWNLYVLVWYLRPTGIWLTQPSSSVLALTSCSLCSKEIRESTLSPQDGRYLHNFVMLFPPSGTAFLPSLSWHIPISSGKVSAVFLGVLKPLLSLTVWCLLHLIRGNHSYIFLIPLFEGFLAATASSFLGPWGMWHCWIREGANVYE